MKIKVVKKSYDEVMAIKPAHHKRPIRPSLFFRTLMKLVSMGDMRRTHFTHMKIGMEKLGRREPALFLMNHSSFIDLEIVPTLLYPRPFNIVATKDSFIGKNFLLRHIGCIPTSKFVADTTLVRDIIHTIRKLKSSVVLFPEAGYSIDGRATVLPDTVGGLIKMLGVPVAMIHAYGAFARDPLYNNLQVRSVSVAATEKYMLSPEDIASMTVEEINAAVREEFAFDNFEWQKENRIRVDEKFRADFLNRVLYKCPHCGKEWTMRGEGISIFCEECGCGYDLDEYGALVPREGTEGRFTHIPDWYAWQREEVKREILAGQYSVELPVDIGLIIDHKCLYSVGDGVIKHGAEGFVLDGCEGKLHYEQKPLASYSLNSDFNWYEIGDVMSIGRHDCLYYCFPKGQTGSVTKCRLATEEIYKLALEEKQKHDAEKKSAKVEQNGQ